MQKKGRKSKAEELKTYKHGREAIEQAYGSEQAFWLMIAEKAKESHPHLKTFLEYTYGKAPNRLDPSHDMSIYDSWMESF